MTTTTPRIETFRGFAVDKEGAYASLGRMVSCIPDHCNVLIRRAYVQHDESWPGEARWWAELRVTMPEDRREEMHAAIQGLREDQVSDGGTDRNHQAT